MWSNDSKGLPTNDIDEMAVVCKSNDKKLIACSKAKARHSMRLVSMTTGKWLELKENKYSRLCFNNTKTENLQ